MAEFSSIAVSVAVTLTLQSAYLSLIKFPKTLMTEANSLQAAMRLFTAGVAEGNFAQQVTNEANDICYRANDVLLEGITERQEIICELVVVRGKLLGLGACREPMATHVSRICAGVERTLALLEDSNLSQDVLRRELVALIWAAKLSLRSAIERMNEARLVVSDEIESRALTLQMAVIEFWGALLISWIGSLLLSALVIWKAAHSLAIRNWFAIPAWILVAASLNVGASFLKKFGDPASLILKTCKTQVEFTRANLIKLP